MYQIIFFSFVVTIKNLLKIYKNFYEILKFSFSRRLKTFYQIQMFLLTPLFFNEHFHAIW